MIHRLCVVVGIVLLYARHGVAPDENRGCPHLLDAVDSAHLPHTSTSYTEPGRRDRVQEKPQYP
jgi:hypothetical protein